MSEGGIHVTKPVAHVVETGGQHTLWGWKCVYLLRPVHITVQLLKILLNIYYSQQKHIRSFCYERARHADVAKYEVRHWLACAHASAKLEG
jgi:hypothetical protein